jgi:hypothetical protein
MHNLQIVLHTQEVLIVALDLALALAELVLQIKKVFLVEVAHLAEIMVVDFG